MTRTGHCLCGAVTFVYDGPENWRGFCHCDSCRRATASPVTAYMGVSHGNWRWTGETPREYASSPGVTRLWRDNLDESCASIRMTIECRSRSTIAGSGVARKGFVRVLIVAARQSTLVFGVARDGGRPGPRLSSASRRR